MTTTEKKAEAPKKRQPISKPKPKPPEVVFRRATVHDTMGVKELCTMFHKEYLNNLDLVMSDLVFKDICRAPAVYREEINEKGQKYKVVEKPEDLKHGKVVGVFSGYFTNYILDNSAMFHELLWYVHPDYRSCGKALYDYCERLVRSQGAASMVMTHMATDQSDRLESLYKRMGYKPLETHYIKRLDKE